MELTIYQIDAFTDQLFGGNPAAVCPLKTWLPSETMQKIALENNLSETAFIVPKKEGYAIRWFTPNIEVDLCGHATLAAAHALFTEMNYGGSKIIFDSKSGPLKVRKSGVEYTMNFPTDQLIKVGTPSIISEGLGKIPKIVFKGKDDYLAIFENQSIIEGLSPNFEKLALLKARGVIASAPGEVVDFVSRCFYPSAGINEDPVTGSAHTTMIPYWQQHFGKKEMSAAQLSPRGGKLQCTYLEDRVEISGKAITYLKGIIFV